MSSTGMYWSLEVCGWVPSPRPGDALVTPWAGHELPVPAEPHPQDGDDLLRARWRGHVPAPRPRSVPAEPAHR